MIHDYTKMDKVMRGQIRSVSEETNRVTAIIPEINDEMEIPISYPFISRSSGIKFIPNIGDIIIVGFTPQLTPKILGFELMDAQHSGNKQLAKDEKCWYRRLEPGEVLLYGGTGDSEVYISNQGAVNISSGVSSINIDSVRRCIEGICGSFKYESLSGVTIKGGPVTRTLPATPLEQIIPGMVEFGMGIDALTGRVVDMKAGPALTNEIGLPDIGASGLPKMFSLKVAAGSIPGVVSIPLGEIYMDMASITLDAPIIRLGGLLAVKHVVLAEPLGLLLAGLFTSLSTLCDAVEPKSGMGATIVAIRGQIGALSTMIPGIASTKVVAE